MEKELDDIECSTVKLYSMEKQKATELLFKGRIYKLDRLETDDKTPSDKKGRSGILKPVEKSATHMKNLAKRTVSKRIDKLEARLGPILYTTATISIRKRPYDMINGYIRTHALPTKVGVKKILKDYYTNIKQETLDNYVEQYLAKAHNTNRLQEPIKPQAEKKPDAESTRKWKESRRKQKPDDGIFFDETYGHWVRTSDIKKIMNAALSIWRSGRSVTAGAIKESSGMTRDQILYPTINYMKKAGQLKRTKRGTGYTYEPVYKAPTI